jgi:predicted phage tail protein
MDAIKVFKWIMYGAVGIVVAVMSFLIGITVSIILTAVYSLAVALGISALSGLVIQDLLEKPKKADTKKPP